MVPQFNRCLRRIVNGSREVGYMEMIHIGPVSNLVRGGDCTHSPIPRTSIVQVRGRRVGEVSGIKANIVPRCYR